MHTKVIQYQFLHSCHNPVPVAFVTKQRHFGIAAELEEADVMADSQLRMERKTRRISFRPYLSLVERDFDAVRPLR